MAFVVIGTAGAAPTPSTGTLVFATAGDRADRFEIAVAHPDGSGLRKLTHQAPGGAFPSWSADGRRIVFGSRDSGTDHVRLWRIRPSGKGLRAIHRYGEPSPGATRFARLTLRGVDILSARGKLLRHLPLRLGRDDFYDDPAVLWSHDARAVAISVDTESNSADYSRVFVARVDGHGPPRALSRRIRRGDVDEFALGWSADDRTLLLEHAGGGKAHTAFMVTVATGERRLVRNDFLPRIFAASPDLGSVAWVSKSGAIFAAPLAGGHKRRLAQARGTRRSFDNVHLSWSPSGREVAYADRSGIHVVRRTGAHNRRLTTLGPWSSPEWSPDGRRLTFGAEAQAIYVVGLRGGVRLVTQSTWDHDPKWSPDGTRIAFMRGPNGLLDPNRLRVVVMKRDGSGQKILGRGYGARWSADSSLLAYVDPTRSADAADAYRLRAGDIFVTRPDGTDRRKIATGTSPTWSPTASRLVFLRYTFDAVDHVPLSTRLFVVAADGTGLREVPIPEDLVLYNPEWSPDGETVSFATSDDGLMAALFVDLAHPEQTHALDFADANAYVWSPDGRWLAFADDKAVKVSRPDGTGIRTLSRSFIQLGIPVWSPDQSALAFDACPERNVGEVGTCDVYVVASDGSLQKRVTRTPGVESAVDWGP